MLQLRCYLYQRRQHESSPRELRMGNRQPGRSHHQLTHQQKVQIERSRAFRNIARPVASIPAFHRQKEVQQRLRIKFCLQLQHGIHEWGLRFVLHRLCPVKR